MYMPFCAVVLTNVLSGTAGALSPLIAYNQSMLWKPWYNTCGSLVEQNLVKNLESVWSPNCQTAVNASVLSISESDLGNRIWDIAC